MASVGVGLSSLRNHPLTYCLFTVVLPYLAPPPLIAISFYGCSSRPLCKATRRTRKNGAVVELVVEEKSQDALDITSPSATVSREEEHTGVTRCLQCLLRTEGLFHRVQEAHPCSCLCLCAPPVWNPRPPSNKSAPRGSTTTMPAQAPHMLGTVAGPCRRSRVLFNAMSSVHVRSFRCRQDGRRFAGVAPRIPTSHLHSSTGRPLT